MSKLLFSFSILAFLVIPSFTFAQELPDVFPKPLPVGVSVKKNTSVTREQAQAIGRKLGGQIDQLANTFVVVHGSDIQVNTIQCPNEASAQAIFNNLTKLKSPPFLTRKGNLVVEYVGRNLDPGLALKTSFELGFVPKPSHIRYRLSIPVALVSKADYMSCNPLFNQLLAAKGNTTPDVVAKIEDLSKRFTFGKSLTLRDPKLLGDKAHVEFVPISDGEERHGATTRFTFATASESHGIPFVTANLELTVSDKGFVATSDTPSEQLTAATSFWPADDEKIRALAAKITAGETSNEGKSEAILRWLSPGANIKYSGQTGSRWGTKKALEQRFGHCWDFSDCFVTLARASGVPARQVTGWLFGSSGHVWAEFYQEDKGWQQVDPTGGAKLRCGIYHIPYFTTEDGEMPILYVDLPTVTVKEPN